MVSHNTRLCCYPSDSEGSLFLGSMTHAASSLICETRFHAAYGHVVTPFASKFRCSLGHCHQLLSASCAHHGFTEYTICALPSVRPKVQCPVGDHHTLSPASCAIQGFTQHTLVPLPLLQRRLDIQWVVPTCCLQPHV